MSRFLSKALASCTRQVIELLEPRRLLTSTVNGTTGNDDIVVISDPLLGVIVVVNKGPEQDVDGSALVINCGDGNDTVEVDSQNLNDSMTVNGGLGNDFLTVAQGNFGDDISGD